MAGFFYSLPAKFHDTTEQLLPSSESENNNGLAADNRKVFLHSACVADIPVEALGKRGPRAISADASLSGGRDAGSRGGAPPTMQQRPQGCSCMIGWVLHPYLINSNQRYLELEGEPASR